MKIGVSGGSGFVGQYVIESLQNIRSTELLKIIDLEKPKFAGNFEFVHGDIRNMQLMDTFCMDIDFVIHLAAAHHDFGVPDEEYFDVNERGTQILLESMNKNLVTRLIYYSSVAVYGTSNLPANETTSPIPDSPYGASKLAAEKKIIEWTQGNADRKSVIIRPTVVIGARNQANMYFLIDQIYKNRYLFHFGEGKNIKSVAGVRNLVGFTKYLMLNKFDQINQYEIFNYIDYPQLDFNQTVSVIHDEMKKSNPRFRVPLPIALTISKIFDFAIAITGKNLPISSARLKKTAAQTQFETVKVAEWNYNPEWSTVDSLKEMVKWYLSTKNVD
jgi:nucleoside-diphosphate-sugar epimerase